MVVGICNDCQIICTRNTNKSAYVFDTVTLQDCASTISNSTSDSKAHIGYNIKIQKQLKLWFHIPYTGTAT